MDQRRCPRCQWPNREQAKFCEQCATLLELACPYCHSGLLPGARFCPGCGQAVPDPTTSRFGPPASYTPPDLAERILRSRAAIEGERKQVTILFADVRGSLEQIAQLDAEKARELIDPILEIMMEAVHRFGGTVNQVLGDGIMALFGAPLAHEDHAVRACYASLRMREMFRRYAATMAAKGVAPVEIRIGLNSGEVVVRSIASDLHMDYSAVGQTTHLAACMEQTATPGTILATTYTIRLVEGYIRATPLGPVSVKGLATPVEIYEIEDRSPIRSRFQVSAARGLTRFVGREAEMRQLEALATRAVTGSGQLVALVGEPGVGKSRLVEELTHSPTVETWTVLMSGAVPYGARIPYLPIVGMVNAFFEIDDHDRHEQIREKIQSRLSEFSAATASVQVPLLALLDVPTDDVGWEALPPAQRRQRTLESLRRLLFEMARVRPVLIVVDDLQWLDSETQAVLDGLVHSLSTSRALLVVTYRPEYRHQWTNHALYTQIRVDPLPPDGAAALLGDLLGHDEALAPLKDYLSAQTEGNPLFLEEMVRALLETRALEGERGAYRLRRRLETIRVPGTVEAVLASRIDRLTPADKRLLQYAAVIGRDVPGVLLDSIADEDDEPFAARLARLQAAEFLFQTQPEPEAQYTFKHALTHEVAYGALLQETRRGVHGRIVDALEALPPGHFVDQADWLAYHSFRGARWDKALRYCRQAGLRAAARSATREAVASLEHALSALNHLGQSQQDPAIGVDLRLDLQSALVPLGDLDRMLGCLAEAEGLAERLGDQRRLGRVLAYMAHCFWWSGEPDRAVSSGQRALALARSLGDFELEIIAQVRLGQAYFSLGDYRHAIAACQATVDALKDSLLRETFGLPSAPAVISRAFMGRSLALLGDLDAGIAMTEDGLQMAEASEHRYGIIMAYWAAGDAYLCRGRLASAITALEHGLQLCKSGGFALMTPIVGRVLAEAYALGGRIAEALQLLEGIVAQLESMKYAPALPSAHGGLAEAYLLAGRLDSARQAAGRALDLCRKHHQYGTEAFTLRTLGAIHAAPAVPDVEAGVAAYRAALGLAEERGMRPLVARCRLGLAQLQKKAGHPSAALELRSARTMFRDLGMDLWLREAEEELAQLGVRED